MIALLVLLTACTSRTPLERALGGVDYTSPEPDEALLRMGKGQIAEMVASPAGTYLAVGTSTGLIIYEAQTLEQQWQVESFTPMTAFAFDPTSLSIIVWTDGELTVRKALNGRLERRIPDQVPHDQAVDSLAFTLDGTALVGYADGEAIAAWSLPDYAPLLELPFIELERAVPNTISSPDGAYLATTINETDIEVTEASSGERLHLIQLHREAIERAIFSPNSDVLYTASALLLASWDMESGELLEADDSFTLPLEAMALSAGASSIATLSGGDIITRWDGIAAEPTTRFRTMTVLTDIAFTPDNQSLATSDADGALIIWDVENEEPLRTFDAEQPLNAVGFGRGGTLVAAAGEEDQLLLWRESDPSEPDVFIGFEAPATALTFNMAQTLSETLLAGGSQDGAVAVWALDAPDDPTRLTAHSEQVVALAFSPNGQHLLSAAADSLLLHALETNEVVEQATVEGVTDAAISPDGQWVAVGQENGRLLLWNLEDGETLLEFDAHSAAVTGVRFTLDGVFIATSSLDGSVILWEFDELLDTN